MRFLLWAFLFASILHIVEEYAYPGGFVRMVKRLRPRYARYFTTRAIVVFNGLQVALCLAALLPGVPLTFRMSIAGLLLINGVVHILTAVMLRGYAPGAFTAVALYLPIALSAFIIAIHAHRMSGFALFVSLALGAAYQLTPLAYVRTRSWFRRQGSEGDA